MLWNPPPRAREDERGKELEEDPTDAILERVPATVEAPRVLSHLTYQDAQTLLFTPSRKLAELSVKRAAKFRDENHYYANPERASGIEPYHAGHSRKKRHGTEHQLKTGILDGVASTNALELGINIGEMDATVQLGYPGQRQSFWQQIGRAGRGEKRALSVLVAEHRTLDQYVITHPDYLLENDVEDAVVDIDNDAVFATHLRCAAAELALDESDAGVFAERERLERAVEMWRRAGQLQGALETGVSYVGRRVRRGPSHCTQRRARSTKYNSPTASTNATTQRWSRSQRNAFCGIFTRERSGCIRADSTKLSTWITRPPPRSDAAPDGRGLLHAHANGRDGP